MRLLAFATGGALAVTAACDGASLVVGESLPKTVDASDAGISRTTEHWVGVAEQHKFPSGSKRVEIILHPDGTGKLRGGDPNVRVDRSTDPALGWPRDLCTKDYSQQPIIEGVEYPVGEITRTSNRLRMTVFHSLPWKNWCELQTPFPAFGNAPDGGGAPPITTYNCVPSAGFSGTPDGKCMLHDGDGGSTPIDCTKAALCGLSPCGGGVGYTCSCTSDRCTSADHKPELIFFVNGNFADGITSMGRIRLVRE